MCVKFWLLQAVQGARIFLVNTMHIYTVGRDKRDQYKFLNFFC